MSTKQRQILTLEESNLAKATKIEYGYRLKQFFRYSTIKSYDDLIQVSHDELENTLGIDIDKKYLEENTDVYSFL